MVLQTSVLDASYDVTRAQRKWSKPSTLEELLHGIFEQPGCAFRVAFSCRRPAQAGRL